MLNKYENKAISTRLKGDNLAYFLKYAKRRRTRSISDTFVTMVEEMQQHLDLSEDEVPSHLFLNYDETMQINNAFLKAGEGIAATPIKKKLSLDDIEIPEDSPLNEFVTITERKPEPEPEPEKPKPEPTPEPEPEEEDDDVIEI